MNAKIRSCIVLGLCLLIVGCGPLSRATDFSEWGDDSPFRITARAAEIVASDQTLLIKFWAVECLDPRAPEVLALFGQIPHDDVRQAATFDAEAIAGYLDALAARDQLVLLSSPALAIMGGEEAEIRVTEPIDRPDLQEGIEPGEFLFPFEVGMRFRVATTIDNEGYIHLDLDYRLESLVDSIDKPLPNVMTTAVNTSVRLFSGQSVVLGGQRLIHQAPGRRPTESVLLLVVNVGAIPPSLRENGSPFRAAGD
jgi:hypothetical protein